MLPAASAEHYAGQQRLTASVLAAAKRMWGARAPNDFDSWFTANVDRLVALVAAGQQRAVAGADDYVAAVLDELGTPIDAAATPITDSLVGVASDGRPLDSLLYGPVITAKGKIAQGAPVAQAWQSGGQALLLRAATQLADASRVATGLGITARKGVGYTRMLNPPSCSRCAILAGRFYRWNAGFRRHPGCDCRGIPCREDRADDLRTDPQQYFESLPESMQDKLFTISGAQAIRDGADINQVVNARRGMSTTQTNQRGWIPQGRLSTADVYGQQLATSTEGVTRRGVAYAAMRRAGYAQRQTDVRPGGRRYFQARAPRLMPESIYEIAENREDALRLLRLNGYLSDGPARRTLPKVTSPQSIRAIPDLPRTTVAAGGGGKPPIKPPTGGQAVSGGEEPRRGSVDRSQVRHLEQHELDSGERLADLGYHVVFRPTSHTRQPDLLIDGKVWELKSPTSSSRNTIMRRLTKGRGQSGSIVLDLARSEISLEDAQGLATNLVERYSEIREIRLIGRMLEDGTALNMLINGGD